MSEAEKPKSAPNLDLSGLDFGPSWAKSDAPARDYSKEVGPRENRGRRDQKGRGPRRDNNRDHQNRDRSSGDRRPHRKDQRGRGKYQDRDRRPRQEDIPAPEGFTAQLLPVEAGLDNIAREIQASGRTYSVFDLAKIVTGARERFLVSFQAPKGTKVIRCRLDGSLWLTKEEALRHFWKAKLYTELYEEVATETEAPKGNFTSVAQCGLSGQYLGPPNYHSYQSNLLQLHREQFAHMSLENYKRKIQVKSGEEAVNAWLEQAKKQIQYRPLNAEEIKAKREAQKATKTKSEEKKDSPSPQEEQDQSQEAETPTSDDSPTPEAENEQKVTPEDSTQTLQKRQRQLAKQPLPAKAKKPRLQQKIRRKP